MKWYKVTSLKAPLRARSTVPGIRKQDDMAFAGAILPEQWFDGFGPAEWTIFLNGPLDYPEGLGLIVEYEPTESELVDLYKRWPALKPETKPTKKSKTEEGE